MAEIKSTLDLVMEKTRHLTLSKEEKTALEHEEQLRKVPGFVRKFLDGAWSLDDLGAELRTFVDQKVGEEANRELIRRFLDEMDPEDQELRWLQALELLAGDRYRSRFDQLQRMVSEFRRTREEWLGRQEERMRADLASMGISGDAVVIAPQKSPEWQARLEAFEKDLADVRKAWQTALQTDR